MVGIAGFAFARILGQEMRQLLRSCTGFHYSTAAKAQAEADGNGHHFLVDYLTDSLNFSRDDAIYAASKVSVFKSQTKPALVVDYLKRIGMDPTHIKTAVSKFPRLLFIDPDKILIPKIQCFQELGISMSDVVKLITRDASFLGRGLETHLRPILQFLRETAGGDQNTLKALKRNAWLLSYGKHRTMEDNVLLLRNMGLSQEKIQRVIVARPSYLSTTKSDGIKHIANRVETEFGIPRSSPMFANGIIVATALSKTTMDKKLNVFRSFGWTDSDISTMVKKQPHSLTISEARLKKVLNFLTKELGYASHYLAFRPMLLMSSLEKKTIPRSQVLRILKENKLRTCTLFTALSFTESKFSEIYVIPYKDKLSGKHNKYG